MGILGAFGGLFGWAARDSFLPAHVVTVTPVIVTRADVQQEGTPLFQAAGWIEPQPSAVDRLGARGWASSKRCWLSKGNSSRRVHRSPS